MARIRQFAKDMGLSYNEAKNLVNKGRKLKDGGTSILESVMNKVKPIKAKKGLSYNEMFPPITQEEFDKLNPKSNIDKLNELSDKKRKQRMKNRKEKVPDRVKGIKDKGDVPPKKIKAKMGTSVNTKKSFPDLSGDGKITQKDILIGKGVIKKSRGGGLAIQGLGFKGVR